MPCLHPISAWYVRLPGVHRGKVAFKPFPGASPIDLPCGQCIGCRLERARQWAVRSVKEAQMHDHNCFITLTYDDQRLPAGRTLVKEDLQKFFKRLRKRLGAAVPVRYLACGEYGDKTQRPHYHAIIFGYEFEDAIERVVKKSDGSLSLVRRSPLLADLWPFGHHSADQFSFDSAAYVAGYCLKKITGKAAEDYYKGREPPFSLSSKRPAIGATWYTKFGCEVRDTDQVVVNAKSLRPPRYFDKLTEKEFPEMYDLILKARRHHLENIDSYKRQEIEKLAGVKLKVLDIKAKRKCRDDC